MTMINSDHSSIFKRILASFKDKRILMFFFTYLFIIAILYAAGTLFVSTLQGKAATLQLLTNPSGLEAALTTSPEQSQQLLADAYSFLFILILGALGFLVITVFLCAGTHYFLWNYVLHHHIPTGRFWKWIGFFFFLPLWGIVPFLVTALSQVLTLTLFASATAQPVFMALNRLFLFAVMLVFFLMLTQLFLSFTSSYRLWTSVSQSFTCLGERKFWKIYGACVLVAAFVNLLLLLLLLLPVEYLTVSVVITYLFFLLFICWSEVISIRHSE